MVVKEGCRNPYTLGAAQSVGQRQTPGHDGVMNTSAPATPRPVATQSGARDEDRAVENQRWARPTWLRGERDVRSGAGCRTLRARLTDVGVGGATTSSSPIGKRGGRVHKHSPRAPRAPGRGPGELEGRRAGPQRDGQRAGAENAPIAMTTACTAERQGGAGNGHDQDDLERSMHGRCRGAAPTPLGETVPPPRLGPLRGRRPRRRPFRPRLVSGRLSLLDRRHRRSLPSSCHVRPPQRSPR